MKFLNIVTCTFVRKDLDRLKLLSHLKNLLVDEQNIRWIVVDDSDHLDEELSNFLPNFAHLLFIGPSKDKGHLQRNLGLEYIYDNNFEGLIYNADDDNKYDKNIFEELRKTQKFSIIPVGNLGPNLVEKAILSNGKFKEWDSLIMNRKYPVDMAAFCFDASLLKKISKPFWQFSGMGGESEFIDKIISSIDEIEFVSHDPEYVNVWHNGLLS